MNIILLSHRIQFRALNLLYIIFSRQRRVPIYVDLDVGQGDISIPSTIGGSLFINLRLLFFYLSLRSTVFLPDEWGDISGVPVAKLIDCLPLWQEVTTSTSDV